MGAKNLGLVFGASLLNPPSIDQYDLANIKLQCSVVERLITSYSFLFEDGEADQNAQKVREKAVATIPAGQPSTHTPASPSLAPEDRRKGFMKRKSTFFATNHYSGNSNRIQGVIALVNKSPAPPSDRDVIKQPFVHRDVIQHSITSDTAAGPRSPRKKKTKKRAETELTCLSPRSLDV